MSPKVFYYVYYFFTPLSCIAFGLAVGQGDNRALPLGVMCIVNFFFMKYWYGRMKEDEAQAKRKKQ